jgi:GTP-binding protein
MVVIVGRPNTGKSTLFNRVVGGRIAITLQQPGVTRDRIIREAEWVGRRFTIVDTGGLVPDSKEEINREVERQVRFALEKAAVVVLVVDGAAGLLPMDEEIAARLRRRGRPFLVAVNKVDLKKRFDEADFYRLGGERLFPVAAEHGTGVDDLLDAVVERLADDSTRRRPKALALAILGRPNVGKSSLLNRLLGHERSIVTPTPGTTRDVVEEYCTIGERTFRLLDTAGIRRRTRVDEPVEYYSVTRAIDQIERCDVALVVIDATEGPAQQDKRIMNLVTERSRGMVVIANKMDIVPEKLVDRVRDWVKQQLAFIDYVPIVFASVLENTNVTTAIRRAERVWQAGARQLPNAVLRERIVSRLESSPPAHDCRVLNLSQVGTRPPQFRLRLSNPDAMTPVYERRVITMIRHIEKFEGHPVRLRVTR